GILFLGLEILIVPGFGLFGLVGILAVLGGLYMSLLGSVPTTPDFTQAGMVLTTSALLILVSVWVLVRTLPRSSRFAKSGIFLFQRTDRALGYESAEVRADLVGQEGKAITDLRPSGTALFGDERVDVVSESEWITEGTSVRVISAEGYRHIVRPVTVDKLEEA
ncbi:MAG: nodulation protein NfeD, partial [Proteobacteria bacterium]|nr:nodulation protein NfeD [Pseudomonadota bacterium]